MIMRCSAVLLYWACLTAGIGCATQNDNAPETNECRKIVTIDSASEATACRKTVKEVGEAIAASLKRDIVFPSGQEELQAENRTVDVRGDAQSVDALTAVVKACGWNIAIEDDGKPIVMSLHPRARRLVGEAVPVLRMRADRVEEDAVHVFRVRDDKVEEIAATMGSRRAVQKTFGVGRAGSLLAISCKRGDLDYVRKVVELLQLEAPPDRHCCVFRMTEERAAELFPTLEETFQKAPQDEGYESQIFWFPEAERLIVDVSNSYLFDKMERVIKGSLSADN